MTQHGGVKHDGVNNQDQATAPASGLQVLERQVYRPDR